MTEGPVLTLVSYGGNNINVSPYKALIGNDIPGQGGFLSNFANQSLRTERPNRFPVYVRSQPQAKLLTFDIVINPHTQANLETIRGYFSAAHGQQYLVANDDTPTARRILCDPEATWSWVSPNRWRVSLGTSEPVWEAASIQTDSGNITASNQTRTLANNGDYPCYPTFTITPNTIKSHANDYIRRKRLVIVNRSELELNDPVGVGYPIDVVEAALDTTTLNGAGKVLSNLDDIRLIRKSREEYRWFDYAGTSPNTKVWANLAYPSRKTAILAADISSGDTTFDVSNSTGFAGWPENSAFCVIDTECISLINRTGTNAGTLTRGMFGTSAASHSAGATVYFVAHPFIDLIYDKTSATAPTTADEQKPVLDLASSSNSLHVWPGPFFNNNDLRTRAFQRALTEDGTVAQHIRAYDSGGALLFEDLLPTAGKPNYNNALIAFPVPVKAGTDVITTDIVVGQSLIIQGFVLDLDGNESRLITQYYTTALTGQTYSTADPLKELRFNARIGVINGDVSTNNLRTFPNHAIPVQYVSDSPVTYVTTWSHNYIRFVLEATTEIDGFILALNSDANPNGSEFLAGLWADNGDQPGLQASSLNKDLSNPTDYFVAPYGATPSLQVYLLSSPVTLLAGSYWLYLNEDPRLTVYGSPYIYLPGYVTLSSVGALYNGHIQFGAHQTRTSPSVFYGTHILPLEQGLSSTLEYHTYATIDYYQHSNVTGITPVFGIISRTAEPQSDAPTATGNTAAIDNFQVQLDTDRTPLVLVGPEETMYLMQVRITNDTTGQYLDVFFPMTLGQSIEINCATHKITDLETNQPIMFALTASDWEEWIRLDPGNNTIRYTEVGVVSTTLASTWRSRWQ